MNEEVGVTESVDSPLAEVKSQEEKAENYLSQEEVNRIVHARTKAAAEKARRETEAKYLKEIEGLKNKSSEDGKPVDESQVVEKVIHQMRQEQYKQQVEKIVNDYEDKMSKGSEFYEDFEAATKDLEPENFLNLSVMAANSPYTAHIMYELGKNPQKLATLSELSRTSPRMLEREFRSLENSIRQNQEALKNHKKAPAPLEKLKSSNAGVDTGQMTLSDFKRAKFLRG